MSTLIKTLNRNGVQPEFGASIQPVLAKHWGKSFERCFIRAFAEVEPTVVTHASTLYLVEAGQERRRWLLKHVHEPEAIIPIEFHRVKREIMLHCQRCDVRVVVSEPTLVGEPLAIEDNISFELFEYVHDTTAYKATTEQRQGMLQGFLSLRRALDSVPANLRTKLSAFRPQVLVENSNLGSVIKEVREILLPATRGRSGRLMERLRESLEGVSAAEPLLTASRDTADERAEAVAHGDFHGYNILFSTAEPSRLEAILDFDNVRVRTSHFDLAWLLDQMCWRPDMPTQLDVESCRAGIRAALVNELARVADLFKLMPMLLRYAAPIVADIAKDILLRGDVRLVWWRYLDILDCQRKLAVHKLIINELQS